LPALLPLKESSCELILEVSNALEAHFPEITAVWREKLCSELGLEGRAIAALIGRLSPLLLQELGLIAAIRKEAKDLARNTGVKARVMVPDAIARMSPETEAAIYRVVQEALHNVAKHAQARSVNIQMWQQNGELHLLIEDDGIGIQGKASSSRGRSFGLAGIKERIGMLGGEVHISSTRGKGTRIEVTVPAGHDGRGLALAAPAQQGGWNA
jgi:glucose-6-phosphate-specific signal transduction histidine kinase